MKKNKKINIQSLEGTHPNIYNELNQWYNAVKKMKEFSLINGEFSHSIDSEYNYVIKFKKRLVADLREFNTYASIQRNIHLEPKYILNGDGLIVKSDRIIVPLTRYAIDKINNVKFKIKAYKVNKKRFQFFIAKDLLLDLKLNPDNSWNLSFINIKFKKVKLGKPITLKMLMKWDIFEANYKHNPIWSEAFNKGISDLQEEASSIHIDLMKKKYEKNKKNI